MKKTKNSNAIRASRRCGFERATPMHSPHVRNQQDQARPGAANKKRKRSRGSVRGEGALEYSDNERRAAAGGCYVRNTNKHSAQSHDEREEPSARTTDARRQRQQAIGKEESDDEPGKRQWRRRRTEDSIRYQSFLGRTLIQGLIFVRTARPQPAGLPLQGGAHPC